MTLGEPIDTVLFLLNCAGFVLLIPLSIRAAVYGVDL